MKTERISARPPHLHSPRGPESQGFQDLGGGRTGETEDTLWGFRPPRSLSLPLSGPVCPLAVWAPSLRTPGQGHPSGQKLRAVFYWDKIRFGLSTVGEAPRSTMGTCQQEENFQGSPWRPAPPPAVSQEPLPALTERPEPRAVCSSQPGSSPCTCGRSPPCEV